MQHVQSGYEELVGILLLVARQMPGMGPHQVKKLEGNVGGGVTRVELNSGKKRVQRSFAFCGG